MNARSAWFFFDDAFIFKLGRVPIPLHLECFGVQLVGRYGLRGRTAELLGRNSREIGISMDQDKKHFRSRANCLLSSRIKSRDESRSFRSKDNVARQSRPVFLVDACAWAAQGALERGDGFPAAALLSQSECFFCG